MMTANTNSEISRLVEKRAISTTVQSSSELNRRRAKTFSFEGVAPFAGGVASAGDMRVEITNGRELRQAGSKADAPLRLIRR